MTPASDLLDLALSRPRDAERQARRLVRVAADVETRSIAHQAIGIVLRDRGDLPAALAELGTALQFARRSDDRDRVTEVLATLGAAECMAGQMRAGLARLSRVLDTSSGDLRARVLLRRAHALLRVGRHREALRDLRQASATFRTVGDVVWEARALLNRCHVHCLLGSIGRAEQDALRAEALFGECGQEFEAAIAVQNQGYIAYLKGDLPRASRLLDRAAHRYQKLGVGWPDLAVDQSTVSLAAGLPADALDAVTKALDAGPVQPSRRAELLLAAATAALALPDPARAENYGRDAERLFRRQDRTWWAVRARLIVVRARFEQGEHGARLFAAAEDVAAELQGARADEATLALLLAGEVAAARGDDAAAGYFGRAAGQRGRGSALNRSLGWLAQARLHALAARRRAVLVACSRGIDALDEHRMMLGSPELRALATSHGRELASLALSEALATGDARRLLTWTERIRATALSQPPVLPSGHARLRRQLARLRDVVSRLNEARDAQLATGPLERERDGLETAIRREQHQLSGRAHTQARFELAELIGALGDHVLVELVEVAGVVHALVVRGGRVTRHVAGSLDDALRAVEYARFQLRRVGRGASADLAAVGEVLADGVLGAARGQLGDAPAVIVPPSRLHGTPWGLMPGLADRPITVSPSAAMWLRARRVARPAVERLVLVAGPDLGTEGAEVGIVAARRPDAVVLTGAAAVVDDVIAAIDGATLAHLAAHGRLRLDNPMFSELRLADGPLTVHDLQRMRRAPFRVVLSACDSGLATPVGADELLGLATTMLSLGSAGVAASVTVVDDAATVPVMDRVHHSLEAGADLAEALLRARDASEGNLVEQATAATFIGLGI